MQIALPLIAILIIVRAWRGWRRSPLYSVKITLQIVGVFLLIVAVWVAVSLGLFSGPLSHSPVALGILAAVAIVAIATGATAIIIRITDRHVAQAPPSAHLVTIHRGKVQLWFWRTVVYLLINAAAALLLPSSWKLLPLGLGGFVLLMCGPMLMGFHMRARRLDFGMSAVIAAPWAHWQYTPAQWESWAKNQLAWERSKAKPMTWRALLSAVLVCAVLFALGALFDGAGFRENVVIVAGLSAFAMLIFIAVNWSGRGNFERRYRRLLAAPAETWFGDDGLFCNGEFTPWTLSGAYLLEATAPRDPPARLVLVFQTFNGASSVQVARRVLIPEGHESDLQMLQQRLRECCRTATVHLMAPAA
jgi:hypothetical protein